MRTTSSPHFLARLPANVKSLLREQLEYRELLVAVVRRDLILRYKQAALGLGWAVLVPVLHMVVFSMVFMRVVSLDTPAPYPIYAYTGLLPWAMFASAVRFSAGSLVANRELVTKVYFPREVFVFSAVLVALVDLMVASLVLVGLMVYYGFGLSWTALLIPGVILIQLAFTAGIGLMLAMANLFYRDVKYLTDVMLTVWMFATSVVYPVDRVGGRIGEVLLVANPMTPIIDSYRDLLLLGELPNLPRLGVALMISVGFLTVGWGVFHSSEHRFAEEV